VRQECRREINEQRYQEYPQEYQYDSSNQLVIHVPPLPSPPALPVEVSIFQSTEITAEHDVGRVCGGEVP
jgi:hypothetical protein